MEVHRQQCQSCGSFRMRNILVREPGRRAAVYVRCAACRQLVARYVLADYYHHGKGIESFLRSHGAASSESGRHLLEEFERAKSEALEGFEAAMKALEELGKDDRDDG
jgi:hypothetical protein